MDLRDMHHTQRETEFIRFLNEGGDIEETEVDHAAGLAMWRNLAMKGKLALVRLRPDSTKERGPLSVVAYDPTNDLHRESLRAEIAKCTRAITRNTTIKHNVMQTLRAV